MTSLLRLFAYKHSQRNVYILSFLLSVCVYINVLLMMFKNIYFFFFSNKDEVISEEGILCL